MEKLSSDVLGDWLRDNQTQAYKAIAHIPPRIVF